jgi:FKBP-type peptidyl-prolyl cis-trans isomerase FklB
VKYLAIYLFTIGLMTNAYAAEQPEVLKDETARINYSVGYQIGGDFRQQEVEIRPEAVLRGIQDALSDSGTLMTPEEMRKTMGDMGKHVAELKQKKRQQIGDYTEKNKQFLVENGKKPGVITTASGLQYRVNKPGRGNPPGLTDRVMVHYRGRLIIGTEFDSSYKRGKPSIFQINKVIKGWTEALQLMKRGDHWQLFIPAELAYGAKGSGTTIPPNSTLIFDIEFISIQ